MKLIKSKVELIQENDPYKMIEIAGRTCYKSEENTTEDSAKEFVNRMIKSGHGAMLEHGTVYLQFSKYKGDPHKYESNKYSVMCITGDKQYYVTTNLRVLVENEKGNKVDEDTGCDHLAQVAWNAIAMLWLDKHNKGKDEKRD